MEGKGSNLIWQSTVNKFTCLPKLVYKATMFAVPEEVIKDITGLFLNFCVEVKIEL